jgi:chromosome segregation ATPase
MESRMEESILNHSVAISRVEDCEDDMNICKNDMDTLRLEQGSMGRDIQILEASMGSVHEELENLGSRVDSCVAAGWRTASLIEGNARFMATICSGQVEVQELAEDLNQKFVRINEVIDKKMVRQDEELDQLVGLVREKIDARMGEFSSNLMEALEIEESRRKDLEAKVAFLEEKLVNSLNHTADLVHLVVSVQSHVSELEDAMMEESEEGGEEVVSSSSSDLDPVENMVAIPVPAPSIVHTLVEIPEEFVPPILRPSSAVPSTLSPEYVQALEDDLAHDGTPEYWADPKVGVDH